jgi:hypothetical protein
MFHESNIWVINVSIFSMLLISRRASNILFLICLIDSGLRQLQNFEQIFKVKIRMSRKAIAIMFTNL